MKLDRVGPGKNIPEEINVIIKIHTHSDSVKYEVDKDTGAMFVDRLWAHPCTTPPIMAMYPTPYPKTKTLLTCWYDPRATD